MGESKRSDGGSKRWLPHNPDPDETTAEWWLSMRAARIIIVFECNTSTTTQLPYHMYSTDRETPRQSIASISFDDHCYLFLS